MKVVAEYIWLDGINKEKGKLTSEARSKTKVFDVEERTTYSHLVAPTWGFDGSSTEQAEGHDSDCVLKPVRVYHDPLRNIPNSLCVLVLNEVYLPPGKKIHPSNTRAQLEKLATKYEKELFWFGLEQEYTFMRVDGMDPSRIDRPLGFPKNKFTFPVEQGKYYCGSGADKIFGREIIEEHLKACLEANVLIAGINAEVMPGQWEYQIGNGTWQSDPLRVADDLIVARYLMDRISEKYGVVTSLEPKPHPKWNGAGAHTNFSTKSTRKSIGNVKEIMKKFEEHHREHIALYGPGIEQRLTGLHETSGCDRFSYGVSNRGASIRIPWQVAAEGKGYLEDRRPCANMDPYVVEAKIIKTMMKG